VTNSNAEVTHGVVEIDGGHRIYAQLLLELHLRTRFLPAGTVVRLYACYPIAPIDLAAWCHLTGHHYRGPATGQPDTACSTGDSDRCPGYYLELRPHQQPSPTARATKVMGAGCSCVRGRSARRRSGDVTASRWISSGVRG